MTKILKSPFAYPRVHENAKCCPSGMPRGIRGFALAIGNAIHSDAVGAHLINLLVTRSGYEEHQARVLRVYLRLHFDGIAVGNTAEALPIERGDVNLSNAAGRGRVVNLLSIRA